MLSTYDIVMLVILVIAALRGAVKGFVWQVAVIGSILLCFAFSETGSIYIAPLIPVKAPLNRWVAMLILYIVLSFAAFGIARMMNNWIERMKFKEFDRHLGFLFGGIKGVILCLIATFFVVTISDSYRQTVMNSHSGHAAAIIMDRLHPVMPTELHDVLEPYIHRLDHPDFDLLHSHDDDDHDHDHQHADHDHDADESVLDKLLENFRGRRSNVGQPADDILAIGPLLKDLFHKISPEDRDKFLNDIRYSAPGRLQDIADVWKSGKPERDDSASPFDSDLSPFDSDSSPFDSESSPIDAGIDAAEQEHLIEDIVATFQAGPEASAEVTRVITEELIGVPDRVAIAVLRDWHADLAKIKPDPDTSTDASVTLDERIVRQLEKANVPLTSLSSALQDRLRESLQ